MAIVLLLEGRNPLLSLADLQELEIPILSSIPRLKNSPIKLKLQGEAALEFQRLASAVSMMKLHKSCLMITSATAGEGKTTVTLGLAKALLTLGFRVLIVDGDFRQAQLSKHLGYSQVEINRLHPIPINLALNLDLVPTTPQGDEIIEFIARGGFKQFLNSVQANHEYDYVLVDSAPLTLTSEAALMTAVVKNILFVTWLGNSDRHPFSKSIEQISRHQASVVGLVINGVQTPAKNQLYGKAKFNL